MQNYLKMRFNPLDRVKFVQISTEHCFQPKESRFNPLDRVKFVQIKQLIKERKWYVLYSFNPLDRVKFVQIQRLIKFLQ